MAHRWKFIRAGGVDQVKLATGADLVALDELDPKLWVALACPVHHVDFDERTLELVDADHDGRIRARELIAATKWIGSVLEDPEVLVAGTDRVELAWIDTSHAEGKRLLEAARALLKSTGKPGAMSLSIDDVTAALAAFDNERANGDGIVPPDAATDPETKQAISDAIACAGSRPDKSGKGGVGKPEVDAFFAEVAARAAWLKAGDDDPQLRPFGAATSDAHDAFAAVRAKVDDYFARCRVAAFDVRAAPPLNRDESLYAVLAARALSADAAEIADFPLSSVAADKPLSLDRGVNPAWVMRLEAFRAKVLNAAGLDDGTLTDAAWTALKAKLGPHVTWRAEPKGLTVAALANDRVRALAACGANAKIEALIDADQAAEPLAQAFASVERLVRYVRDLFRLANNFVAFRDFYARSGDAIFQAGRLFIDTRECELCVRVADSAKHATMGPLANAYLLYCDCRNAGGQTLQIAAIVSDGDVDNLMVGRNGVFYDRKGADWDATVTRIVENPISVRQAFWAPYKKVMRVIEEQIAKRAADADQSANQRLAPTVEEASRTPEGAPAAGAPAASQERARPTIDIGTVAALGVAVGGITAAITGLLGHLFSLGLWMPFGLMGLMLAISGPSMAVAWMKLNRRNLGPILDANGWAVNAMAKLNVPLGSSLTHLAKLPSGSSRDLRDPFAKRSLPWRSYVAAVVLLVGALAWASGRLNRFLPTSVHSDRVLQWGAPRSDHTEPAASDHH